MQGIDLSPAQILYGRQLKDCLPSQQEALSIREDWRIAADERERALRTRHVKAVEVYDEHAKDLPELEEGDHVAVQNGNGSHPKRWDKTGRIMRKFPFRQYHVKVDGSNRLTLRNRKFLRKIDPVSAHHPPRPSSTSVPSNIQPVDRPAEPLPENGQLQQSPSTESQPVVDTAPTLNMQPPEPVRRSGRVTRPRELFEASLGGKHHGSKTVQ